MGVYYIERTEDYLEHHGIRGQKWGKGKYYIPGGGRTQAGTDHQVELNRIYRGNKPREGYTRYSEPYKSRSERSGMSDKTKQNLKKAAIAAGVVAGTALAVYGAYKFSEATKDKAFEKYMSYGKEYVEGRTELEINDLDKEISKAKGILNDSNQSAYYRSGQEARIRGLEKKKEMSLKQISDIESKYQDQAKEASKDFKTAFKEVYGSNRKGDVVKDANNLRDNYGHVKSFTTQEERAKTIAKNLRKGSRQMSRKAKIAHIKRTATNVVNTTKKVAGAAKKTAGAVKNAPDSVKKVAKTAYRTYSTINKVKRKAGAKAAKYALKGIGKMAVSAIRR